MGAPTPIPRYRFSGDPDGVRRYAARLDTAADGLRRRAGTLAATAAGLPGCWNSVPSAARAAGRVDALADVLRAQADRCTAAGQALGAYAGSLTATRDALDRANAAIDAYNADLAAHRLPCRPQWLVDAANAAAADLAAADARCTAALTAFVAGEGRGAGAVTPRLHAADTAAGMDPAALAAALRAAAGARPRDPARLAELLHALGRLTARDPAGAAVVATALGPLLSTLPALGAGQPGWDRRALSGVVTSAQAARTRVGTAPGTPPSPGGDHGGDVSAGDGSAGNRTPRTGTQRTGTQRTGTPAPIVPIRTTQLHAVLTDARHAIGRPYRFGATGPDAYDCSGLTLAAWAAAGVHLPHDAAAQYAAGRHVPLRGLRPGDLVFWADDPARPQTIRHVALYVGHGRIIEAATPGSVVHERVLDLHERGLVALGTRPAGVSADQAARAAVTARRSSGDRSTSLSPALMGLT